MSTRIPPVSIAAYVREDLKARILSGAGIPPRLTLRDLSRRYGVSLTPVRQAVEDLVGERLLRRETNGRLSVQEDRVGRKPSARTATAPPGAKDQTLARDIMKRSLQGGGEFLREEAAAERHGMGRTQLRHGLGRLAAAGMLEQVPRRGWRIRPFREEDVGAWLEVRELLELKALDLARPRLARPELERLLAENVCSGGDPHVDGELHAYLVERSGNRYIRDFFGRHGAYFTTLFYFAARGAAIEARMARQHRRIIEAMIAADWETARAELGFHIRVQRPALRQMRERLAALPLEKWPEIPLVAVNP